MGGVAGPDGLQIGLAPRRARRRIGFPPVGGERRAGAADVDAGIPRLDDRYLHVVGAGDDRALRGGPAALRHRRGLHERDSLPAQIGSRAVEILGNEGEMINGAASRRCRHPLLVLRDEQPDAAEEESVDPPLQLGRLSTKAIPIPRQRRGRIGRAQVDVVEPRALAVFKELDASAPGIEDEAQLEEVRHVAERCAVRKALQPDARALHTDLLELGHFGRQIREREADVIDARPLRASGRRLEEEDELDDAAACGVAPVGHRLALHVLDVPPDALRRARRRDGNLVEGGLRRAGRPCPGSHHRERDDRERETTRAGVPCHDVPSLGSTIHRVGTLRKWPYKRSSENSTHLNSTTRASGSRRR